RVVQPHRGRIPAWIGRRCRVLARVPRTVERRCGSWIRFRPMDRDFGLSADERDLVGLVRKWADDRVGPVAARVEEEERFPRDLFGELGGMGFGGVPYDERYGGGGQSHLLYVAVVEEVARAFLSLGVGLSVHHLCAFGIHQFGSEELKGRFLPALLSGE